MSGAQTPRALARIFHWFACDHRQPHPRAGPRSGNFSRAKAIPLCLAAKVVLVVGANEPHRVFSEHLPGKIWILTPKTCAFTSA
jgi:hypothetical protein